MKIGGIGRGIFEISLINVGSSFLTTIFYNGKMRSVLKYSALMVYCSDNDLEGEKVAILQEFGCL